MMKNTLFTLASIVAVLGIAGCGNDQAPPPEAMAPRTSTQPVPSNKVLTKEEKIQRIKDAPISEDQKKAAIEKVNSEPG